MSARNSSTVVKGTVGSLNLKVRSKIRARVITVTPTDREFKA